MKREKQKLKTRETADLKEAIKAKCAECMCGQKIDCEIDDCALYPYRPYRRISKDRYCQEFLKN